MTPQTFFGEHYAQVLDMMSAHSPFPAAQGVGFGVQAKRRAAAIHLEETVFFAEKAYGDLQPADTVELCAGFAIPSIVLQKHYGVRTVSIDADSDKMKVGAAIAALVGVTLTLHELDLFFYLRDQAPSLQGKTLLATAAYCRDKARNSAMGSGERDIVSFAREHGTNLALLPYRSGEVLRTGIPSERNRVIEYEELLHAASYETHRHSTRVLPSSRGAPDWFLLDILTARRP